MPYEKNDETKRLQTYFFAPQNLDDFPVSDVESEDNVLSVDVVVVKDNDFFVDQNLVDVHRLAQARIPGVLVKLLGHHVPDEDDPVGFVTT